MKCVPLGDPPCKKRANANYERARAEWVARHAEHAEVLTAMETRVLALPQAVGKPSKSADGARHVHFADHYVLFYKHHRSASEVEFLNLGHHDKFFRR